MSAVPKVSLGQNEYVRLPPIVTGASLDGALAEHHHALPSPPSPLIFDMSEVRFLHVECITPLIAEISARQKKQLRTIIRLPRSSEVRQALRSWDFARALRVVTGVRFFDFVDPQDQKFFQGLGGDLKTRVYGLETYSVDGEVVSLPPLTQRFMPIRHWNVKSLFTSGNAASFQRAVLDETSRWREDPVVRASLQYHLGQYYGYLWTHIVHEAMSNAFRHGAATSVVATSKADKDPGRKDVHLMLTFWDDGIPMYETLRKGLESDRGIRGSAFGKTETLSYRTKSRTNPDRPEDFIASSDSVPDASCGDDRFLLATLYPGITADPTGLYHVPHPEVGQAGALPTLPGMGLSNLVNGACDVLHGSVVFRSGEYFMSVKSAPRRRKAIGLSAQAIRTNYAVKIERRWPVNGNIVIVRLPLRNVPREGPVQSNAE